LNAPQCRFSDDSTSIFDQLKIDPRGAGNVKRLAGELSGLFRYRVGVYRVLFRVDDRTRMVTVLKIAHRSAAY